MTPTALLIVSPLIHCANCKPGLMSQSDSLFARAFTCVLAEDSPPEVPALDNTYGALLLGTSFGLMYVSRLSRSSMQLNKTKTPGSTV